MSRAESRAALGVPRHPFILRRLFSLTGVVPVGVFLLFHLGTYASLAEGGAEARSPQVRAPASVYGVMLEVLLLGVPLLYHALYGLKIIWDGSSTVLSYPTSRNWVFTFQRWSGVVALLFIGYHIYAFRIPLALGHMQGAELPTRLRQVLSTTSELGVPIPLLILLVGLAACIFHFTTGLLTFCASWGITTSKRSQEVLGTSLALVGLVVFLVGTNAAVHLATGAPLTASFTGANIFGGADADAEE